jgi:hypothetical protein
MTGEQCGSSSNSLLVNTTSPLILLIDCGWQYNHIIEDKKTEIKHCSV